MKKFLIICALFLSLKAQAAPIAILTGVKGAVQIVQGGKTVFGKNGVPLEAGDSVRVGAGGAATVYYANRAPQSLKANQQMTVAAPGATSKPSVWSNVYKGVASGFARRGEKVGATVRGPKDAPFAVEQIIPLSPVNSRVLQKPKLSWVFGEAAVDFQVILSDEEDNELWKTATAQSSLEIPAQLVLQEGAKYFWRVVPRFANAAGKLVPDEEKASLDAWFAIVPAAEKETASLEQREITEALKDETESTRQTAQASALAERGFYDEAIAILTNRNLETSLSKDNVPEAIKEFDVLLVKMDEAARWQLRRFYADTKQIEFAHRIAPEITGQPAIDKEPNPNF